MTTEYANGYLHGLTYAAQFEHPLSKGIDRVMGSLVKPKLPLMKTATHLNWILQLLRWSESLSMLPSPVEGRPEEEIRDFLRNLALKIQKDYPWAICSGYFSSTSGPWRCYEHPEIERVFARGETLPPLNAVEVVWERVPVKGSLGAIDALKNEFTSYYTQSCLMGAVLYHPAESFSQASAERLREVLSTAQIGEAKNLLQDIFLDKNNPITQDVIKAIKFDWFENEETAAWYQKFIQGIISELE